MVSPKVWQGRTSSTSYHHQCGVPGLQWPLCCCTHALSKMWNPVRLSLWPKDVDIRDTRRSDTTQLQRFPQGNWGQREQQTKKEGERKYENNRDGHWKRRWGCRGSWAMGLMWRGLLMCHLHFPRKNFCTKYLSNLVITSSFLIFK